MIVIVRFIGSLRAASRKSKFSMKLERTITLREIVKRIVEENPRLKRALIDPELDDPKTNALMLVNGRDSSVLDGLETKLKDGDEVVFVSVVHGG